ncbi:helix-turn-helix transcriptional regulator [Streptomyces sp. NPDC051133]|uniref:helix-turn-helix domain-containing protein n=1 Tax=Streptomyces sp. NPDC051133 TaxID=3155521 RepID=UPI00341F39AD
MRERDETTGGSPIGARLAAWRAHRRLSREDVASRAGLDVGYVVGLETGADWVDRRGRLAVLAGALRLDVSDLTGQPYAPRGAEHAAVRAVAFHLRRRVLQWDLGTSAGRRVDDLTALVRNAVTADTAGDEYRLALVLPELIDAADLAVAAAARPEAEEANRLRVQAHVLGAGLLRRLGYKDLAWMLLHRARPGIGEPLPVLVEEVHLLIDLGLPEYALARAERAQDAGAGQELVPLTALAQAMAGRRRYAERLLDTAAAQAESAGDRATMDAARAAVAIECGDPEAAVDHVRAVDQRLLEGASRSSLLVVAAAAEARQDHTEQAVARLLEADSAAPFRLRLDPLARDLVATLAVRTTGTYQAAAVGNLAERAGLR